MREEELLVMERQLPDAIQWKHRLGNQYTQKGRSLVAKVTRPEISVKQSIDMAVKAIGGIKQAIRPDDKVLLKANFNSDDPFPASTDLGFLTAVIELLREEGIHDLTLGERSGWPWMPTDRVLRRMKVYDAMKALDVPVIDFDHAEYVDVQLEGSVFFPSIGIPKPVLDFDKIIYLPCMKHHFLAGFTMSIKLTTGMVYVVDMKHLHFHEPLKEKIAEFALAVQPDLIIMDGRKAFISDGPDHGTLVEPGVIMASGDQLAIDVEGVRILQSYGPPASKEAVYLIAGDVWELDQIARARMFGIGATSDDKIQIIKVN
ncbi:MAG: DUF362 domain-containing protein [Chloroflexi bacterium]|nr:DUF362 domain-containing protein [Chloroflexota bacterium]